MTDKSLLHLYFVLAERPNWLLEPEDTLSDIGNSKTLSCKASGVPEPTYSWYFNSKRILPGKEFTIAGGNLTISPIERLHSGMYQCSARNIHGELISSVRLQVIGRDVSVSLDNIFFIVKCLRSLIILRTEFFSEWIPLENMYDTLISSRNVCPVSIAVFRPW